MYTTPCIIVYDVSYILQERERPWQDDADENGFTALSEAATAGVALTLSNKQEAPKSTGAQYANKHPCKVRHIYTQCISYREGNASLLQGMWTRVRCC